ncbi:MAG TPA: tyrosine-type recombinase/integrase [Ktedonobacterales bacterium]|nr:tyrosine-type recombinase/integrase [Ktedonobacterales bacterium]
MLIQDAIEGFLLDLKAKHRSWNTLRHYEHKLRIWSTWMAEQYGVTDLAQITIAQLRAFILDVERSPVTRRHPGRIEQEGDRKVSDITVYGYAQSIRTFCKWVVIEELLDRNPAARLAKPSVAKRLIPSFTVAHLQAMFASCDLRSWQGLRDYTLMLVLLDTGMRASELCGLTLDDIHQDHLIVMGKGRKEREIGLNPATAKFLWKYTKLHRKTTYPNERHVFLSRRGEPLTPSGVDQMLYRIRDQADIEGVRVSAHTFRHSFARMWLEHGGEIYSLSRLLGHTNVQTTEVYLRDFQSRQARQHHTEYSPLATFRPPKGKPQTSTRFHSLLPPASDHATGETDEGNEGTANAH